MYKVIWGRYTIIFLTDVCILFPIIQTANLIAYSPIFHPYLSDLIFGYHFPHYNIGSPSHSPFLCLSQVYSLWVQLSLRIPKDLPPSFVLAPRPEI